MDRTPHTRRANDCKGRCARSIIGQGPVHGRAGNPFDLPKAIRVKLACAMLLAAATALGPSAVHAYYDYPTRPVRIVVGAPPGDSTDILARVVAHALGEFFSQPFSVDSIIGANGNRAATHVARSNADGYTLLAVSARFTTSISIHQDPGYDPLRDFEAVARLGRFRQMLVVNPSLGVKNVDEFFSMVRARPGRITIASAGTGTTSHLATELMKIRAGWLSAVHVPYRSHALAVAGLLGNHVHAFMATVFSAQAFVKSGRLRALAVADEERVLSLPHVPTFAEAGYPGIESSAWCGIVAPAGVPYEAVVRLNLAIQDMLRAPTMRRRFAAQGAELVQEPHEAFARFLYDEVDKWAKVVKASGLGPPE